MTELRGGDGKGRGGGGGGACFKPQSGCSRSHWTDFELLKQSHLLFLLDT